EDQQRIADLVEQPDELRVKAPSSELLAETEAARDRGREDGLRPEEDRARDPTCECSARQRARASFDLAQAARQQSDEPEKADDGEHDEQLARDDLVVVASVGVERVNLPIRRVVTGSAKHKDVLADKEEKCKGEAGERRPPLPAPKR